MSGVTFPAWVEGRLVVVAEILDAISPWIDGARWRLLSLDLAPGPQSEAVYAASGRQLSTAELRRLMSPELQNGGRRAPPRRARRLIRG